ncbi:hypothetical protein BM1_01981 [Bipolaris maydis]|nr:hypothetical protein BM1_01981 [Bipolaris maydis]
MAISSTPTYLPVSTPFVLFSLTSDKWRLQVSMAIGAFYATGRRSLAKVNGRRGRRDRHHELTPSRPKLAHVWAMGEA